MYRIGYDAKRLFNNFTGLGNYSRTLLYNLIQAFPEEEYFLYTPEYKESDQTRFFLDSPMFNVRMPQGSRRLLWRTLRLANELKKDEIDLYHGLSHEIPIRLHHKKIPSVVTIHDLIFRHYPEQYKWLDRKIYDRKFKYACVHSDRVVAISESTKADVVNFYGIDEGKVDVVYQSCHEGFMVKKTASVIAKTLETYQLPTTFMLYVGSLIPRKNLLGIIEAMRQLPADLRLPMVIVGKGDAYKKKVLEKAREYGLVDLLYFVNPVFADLPALYQAAQVFLYPSCYEGFGIPILEALFSEVPVITSNVSSLPEAGGKGAYLVTPDKFEEISEGIRLLLTDEDIRAQRIAEGYQHAQKFKGDTLAKDMMNVYKRVLG